MKPKDWMIHGSYYDLIKVPHGHIPVPKVRFWDSLPIPLDKKVRDEYTFGCPECGQPSFFKINYVCYDCQNKIYEDKESYNRKEKYSRRLKRQKIKNRFKKIEYIFLPVLVLLGKATYMKTSQMGLFNHRDYWYREEGDNNEW